MFLKSELLESNGSSVTLFQLSALQRIEHLEYLKQMEAVEGGDIQAAVTLTVTSGAYRDDDSEAVRRGVIAQQVEQIDPQYVHSAEGVGKMTLDLNPLLMDALAAIKALNAKVVDLSQQIEALK